MSAENIVSFIRVVSGSLPVLKETKMNTRRKFLERMFEGSGDEITPTALLNVAFEEECSRFIGVFYEPIMEMCKDEITSEKDPSTKQVLIAARDILSQMYEDNKDEIEKLH